MGSVSFSLHLIGRSMRHESFKYLQALIVMEDPSMREKMLEAWWKAWIVDKTTTQSVLNKSLLTADQTNMVCESVAGRSAIEIMYEQGVHFNLTNKSISATITAIRNKPRKTP
jgi:hypothetical protein